MLALRAAVDVKLEPSERRLGVFSIAPKTSHVHPFDAALVTEGAQGGKVAQRVIRNQALTRGAPIAGRALVSAGTAIVAYGVTRRGPKPKQFHLSSAEDWRSRHRRGWEQKSVRQMRKTHVFRKTSFGSPQIDVQKARVRAGNRRRAMRSRRVLTGAGTLITVGGRTLPAIAYGYIGYDMLRRHRMGQDVDVQAELETATFGMTTGEALSAAADLYTQAEMTYQVSKVVFDIGMSYL